MKIKLLKIKEATRENISEISILDIQSATIYESAIVFFQENKNAKDCFAMLAKQDYTVDEILNYSKEIQEKRSGMYWKYCQNCSNRCRYCYCIR